MRFGRVLKTGDQLFASSCQVSTGAIILPRTGSDDYVRFRVPDTDCPPLPEPDSPPDSGVADEAEPTRWIFSGNTQYVGGGWQFGPVQFWALNEIEPSYLCYPGDFETEITLSWSVIPPNESSGGLDGWYANFDSFRFGLPDYNHWIELGVYGEKVPEHLKWHLSVRIIEYGVRTEVLGWLLEGQQATFRLRRVGPTLYAHFDTNSTMLAWNVEGPVRLKMERDYTIEGWPAHHIPRVTVTHWQTLSGAPGLIWVETPVVDMGSPRRLQGCAFPQGVQAVWRASNSPFNASDPTPSWNNPTGEYRYWQARATTTDIATLIERIEFGYLELEAVWLRNRLVWLARSNRNPVTVPFRPVAWSHRVAEINQPAGGYSVTFADPATEYSLLLEER